MVLSRSRALLYTVKVTPNVQTLCPRRGNWGKAVAVKSGNPVLRVRKLMPVARLACCIASGRRRDGNFAFTPASFTSLIRRSQKILLRLFPRTLVIECSITLPDCSRYSCTVETTINCAHYCTYVVLKFSTNSV